MEDAKLLRLIQSSGSGEVEASWAGRAPKASGTPLALK